MKVYETKNHVVMDLGSITFKIHKESDYTIKKNGRIIGVRNPITRQLIFL